LARCAGFIPGSSARRRESVTGWNTPEVKAAIAQQEKIIHPSTPEAAAAFFKSERARYAGSCRGPASSPT
jgi:hypothetical protein